MTTTFLDWLKLEVEPKVRVIKENFDRYFAEGWSQMEREIYATEIARLGISPYHYWVQNQSASGVSQHPPSSAGPSTLSPDLRGRAASLGLEVNPAGTGVRIPPGKTIEKDAFMSWHAAMRGVGWRYKPEQREWVAG